MQAHDAEGDKLQYSIQLSGCPADAAQYFTINSTSGELRLASRRLPVPAGPDQQREPPRKQDSSDDGQAADGDDGDRTSDRTRSMQESVHGEQEGEEQQQQQQQQEQQEEGDCPGYLYCLNVAANDGVYDSVVELLIHVFNSTALGTRSPVALTMESGRRCAGERLMRDKTREFFEKLGVKRAALPAGAQQGDNSTVVIPSFVNPALVLPARGQLPDDSSSGRQHRTESAPLPPPAPPQQSPQPKGALQPTQQQLHLHLHEPEPSAHLAAQTHADKQPAGAEQLAYHQPMVLSLIAVVCSCLVILFVLLVFIVPLSVKRLKRRLKNVELKQHEQLSQKTSSSAASSTSGSSTLATSGRSCPGGVSGTGGFSSLSQFTLASGASTILRDQPEYRNEQRLALGRQSSLDSALAGGGSHFCADMSLSPLGPQGFSQNNNNNNNHLSHLSHTGATIANPVYLQRHFAENFPALSHLDPPLPPAAQVQVQVRQPAHVTQTATQNIYCPIDDEFYSTINTTESTTTNQLANKPGLEQVGSLIGQTRDSRAHLGSQCAAHLSEPFREPPPPEVERTSRLQSSQRAEQRAGSPAGSTSSRSSTRSLARFLSLPARHWAHHRDESQQGQEQEQARRKGGFLAELEYHFRSGELEQPAGGIGWPSGAAQTIARTDRVAHEQQVRHKRPRTETGSSQSTGSDGGWEIERHRLKFLDILDEGLFGLVWRCSLRNLNENSRSGSRPGEAGERQQQQQVVAVKTLKGNSARGARERDEFLAEIEIMKLVAGHPNVVRILHSCTRDLAPTRPLLLVMEHVELGKLQAYLERCRASQQYATTTTMTTTTRRSNYDAQRSGNRSPGFQLAAGGDYRAASSLADYSHEPPPLPPAQNPTRRDDDLLTSRDLIAFIYHVAQGMEFVSSRCVVHRDLASRNILVSAERVCKIGDFGMARHVANANDVYERHSRNTKIPVRWMAPEVLLENSYTIQSDVFSFGILMWEIVTLASTPYRHLKTEQIVEAVARQGARPERPDYCHALLYQLMAACWRPDPKRRPTFGELVKQLDAMLMSGEEYIELDQYPDHNYYNLAPKEAPLELL
ncbi:tyrosine kinase receptor Cad96Ca [Olea europaea subsp. europaea]|uniref:Tyrosine kinase receptor Cad96Ca n=1 Tax=Olea europaea subsp. europaea TaxID=158383 RepID=A0A8S0TGG1_OLEEU|nr:tyrosine kinase receptor Cad96Ca [Olea europaea subsp. europaea]